MGIISEMAEKFKNAEVEEQEAAPNSFMAVIHKIQNIIGIIVRVLYRLRKIVLAVPVGFYALKLAAYNMGHLPETVGLILQADGSFAIEIAKSLAVIGPLGLTAGCLAMMFLSRKAMYPWVISVFSLCLPVLLLVSNLYPA